MDEGCNVKISYEISKPRHVMSSLDRWEVVGALMDALAARLLHFVLFLLRDSELRHLFMAIV